MTKLGLSFICFVLVLVNAFVCSAEPTAFICTEDHVGLTVQQFIQAAIDDARAKDTWVDTLSCIENTNAILGSGPLPTGVEIYNSLVNTTNMLLLNDAITGTIPTEFGLLTNLKTFGIGSTHLTSTIPKEIFNGFQKLSTLIVAASIRGTIPSEIDQMSSLESVAIGGPLLTGIIFDHLARLPALSGIQINNSSFSGTIPPDLFISKKSFFSVTNSNFSGTIPSDLFTSNMSSWNISGNHFSGTIPVELFTSTTDEIDMSNNRFSGTIPTDLFSGRIYYFDISNNRFSGTIPSEITNLNETTPVDLGALVVNCLLGGNRFTGTMPEHKCRSNVAASFVFPTESPTRSPSAFTSGEVTNGPTILSPSDIPITQPKITSDGMIFIMIAIGGILLALITAYLIINENYKSIMKINDADVTHLENESRRPEPMLARELTL